MPSRGSATRSAARSSAETRGACCAWTAERRSGPALAEHRPLFLDAALERRARVHSLDERGELGELRAIGREAGVAQVHEHGSDGEVGDREPATHEVLVRAELRVEIGEHRAELVADHL